MTTSILESHRLGPISAIPPGEGRSYRVDGVEVAVFRTRSNELFATQAHCPHRGAPLADGLVGGGRLVCPFHSFAFELTSGEPVMNPCPALRTYPVAVDADGEIVIDIADEREET